MMSHLHYSSKLWRGPFQLPCATTEEPSHSKRSQNDGPTSYYSSTSTASNNLFLLLVFIIVTCLTSSVTALEFAMPIPTALDLASFADSGILLVDRSPNPNPRIANWESHREDLRRRDVVEKTTTTMTATTLTTSSAQSSSTTASTSTSTTVTSTLSLPSPFDSSLGNNFTVSNCPVFIDQFISTSTFKSCLPFSLLLQTSTSFFKAQRSSFLLTETLDASCSANETVCANYLDTVSNNLTTEANCKADYELGNPVVVEAHNGLIAYRTLYQASCLHNPKTDSYCAVDAFTNTSSPTDSYPYYLPLGRLLTGGATPTCDSCLENTMAIFQKASANRSQPIFETYASAAEQINELCGPTFTNESIPAALTSGASLNSAIGSGEGVGALVLVLAVALWMF